MQKRLIDISCLLLGAFIFAVAINVFIIPNDLGEGGVTGTTIILYYLYGWSPGIVSFVLNSFLITIGYRFLDKTTTIYTIIAVTFHSLFLYLTESWKISSDEIFLDAIFGGVLAGVGIGLILKVGGTTAGSVILAKLTNKYFGWNMSYGLLFIDVIVVLASYFIIGIESVMLTIVMLYIGTKVMEFILEGLNAKKAVTIISEKPNEIAEQVNDMMSRGVTVFSGYGYYTKKSKEIIYVIINKQEIIDLKKIVKSTDKDAFIAIHDVRDVFGKGFLDISRS